MASSFLAEGAHAPQKRRTPVALQGFGAGAGETVQLGGCAGALPCAGGAIGEEDPLLTVTKPRLRPELASTVPMARHSSATGTHSEG